jgi:hypothetical protein
MTCRNKEMAARVVSYQELDDHDRADVDSHVATCDDCAQTFWALGRFVGKLNKIGESHRALLAHPPEEQIIQLAVDPKLLSPQQRITIQRHFEHDRCVACERIYWSVLQSEKECIREAGKPPTATLWQAFFLDWKKPVLALLAAFAVLQSIEIGVFLKTRRQEAEYRAQLAALDHTAAQAQAALLPEPGQPTVVVQPQSIHGQNVPSQNEEKTLAGLQPKSEVSSGPTIDAAYAVLLTAARGADTMRVVKIPQAKLFVVLQANLSPELGSYEKYKLVLQDGQGKTVKSDQATQQDGTLNYLVRKELLRPGSYSLQVSGLDGVQEHYLAQFPFRIAATR